MGKTRPEGNRGGRGGRGGGGRKNRGLKERQMAVRKEDEKKEDERKDEEGSSEYSDTENEYLAQVGPAYKQFRRRGGLFREDTWLPRVAEWKAQGKPPLHPGRGRQAAPRPGQIALPPSVPTGPRNQTPRPFGAQRGGSQRGSGSSPSAALTSPAPSSVTLTSPASSSFAVPSEIHVRSGSPSSARTRTLARNGTGL
ncbi:MAG: hypothetical protein Q9210_005087 [Variospora velana]